jgi:hypothetical protein
MSFNPNPFTQLQIEFLKAIRNKMIEIRNPESEIIQNRDFEFTVECTKKFGAIPKIKFKSNSLEIKKEIMNMIGYKPVAEKKNWHDLRNAAASNFDKHWDNLMARLVKSGKMLATFNELFSEEGQSISEVIRLVQKCIDPMKLDGNLNPKDNLLPQPKSCTDELNNIRL